jgi:alpha-mannosidase
LLLTDPAELARPCGISKFPDRPFRGADVGAIDKGAWKSDNTAMNLTALRDALLKKTSELDKGFSFVWRYPKRVGANPQNLRPKADWAKWDPSVPPPKGKGHPENLTKNRKNWYYADVKFPHERCGVDLAGDTGLIWVYGYSPFMLYLDGKEQFKETHVWHATGPIADPLPRPIEPGKMLPLAICLEPTEIPFGPLAVSIHSQRCMDIAMEIGNAMMELSCANAAAKTPEQQKLIEAAAGQFDLKALAKNDFSRFAKSVAAMEQTLASGGALAEAVKTITVHLVGHTHIDMDWMWTWEDTVHCIRRDFKAVTDIMDDYPEVRFTNSQIPTYEVAKDLDPTVFEKVKQRVAEGRWEVAAATYVENDLNMADGESVARQILYAADWSQENLGKKSRVFWAPDTFGHPGNMPQLARLGEFDCYFHWRCNPGGHDNWPARVWEGEDGSSIPAFSEGYGGVLYAHGMIGNVLNYLDKGFDNVLHIWGMGDHGGALSRRQLEIVNSYRDRPLMPTFRFSTMAEFFAAISQEKDKFPRNTGETWSLFEGCFTTHARIKQYNRRCETALLTAEALAALAGLDRREPLREAWKKMLFNQFHDIFDGAAVHDAYINAYARAESSIKAANKISAEAAGGAGRLVVGDKAGAAITLINPLGFERSQIVRANLPRAIKGLVDDAGRAIPVQRLGNETLFAAEKVPAFSTRTFAFAPAAADPVPPIAIREDDKFFRVETATAIIQLSKLSGAIGAYFDKSLGRGRELVPYGYPKNLTHDPTTRQDLAMNVFTVLDEAPNTMSAWLVNDILREEHLLRGAKVTLEDNGPVFARFRVRHAFRKSAIDQQILIFNQFPRVDFDTTVDWRERGNRDIGIPQLKVSFNAALTAARARFEGPFFITERRADGLDQPSQKFVDISGEDRDGKPLGFTLLNDSKYGFDALGGRLRMTLLRNPYAPDPETDNGVHTFRYAFLPHGGGVSNAELMRQGMAYNRPMAAIRTNGEAATGDAFLRVDHDAIVITALRQAEHSDALLLRLFETSGKPVEATIATRETYAAAGGAEEVNFLENPIAPPSPAGAAPCAGVTGNTIRASFRPYEVKTLLLRRDATDRVS